MFRRKDVKIFNVPDWSDTTTKTYDLSTVAGREQVPINLDEIKDVCFIYVRDNNEYYRLISDTTSGTTRTLVFDGSKTITITKTSTTMTVVFSAGTTDIGVTDTTLTLSGVPADAKATGDDISEIKESLSNLYNQSSLGYDMQVEPNWLQDRCINIENNNKEIGEEMSGTNLKASDYIAVQGKNSLFVTMPRTSLNTPPNWGICFYDKDKNAIITSGVTALYNGTTQSVNYVEIFVPTNAKYFRTTYWSDSAIDTFNIEEQFNYYFTPGNYEDFAITNETPSCRGLLNAVRRARQLTDIDWTPLVKIPRYCLANANYSGEAHIYFLDWCNVGKDYRGIPYSGSGHPDAQYGQYLPNSVAGQWGYYMMFVGLDIDIETFITASRYPNSIMGTKTEQNTYNFESSPYGDVCNALVSYALGIPQPIWGIANFTTSQKGARLFRLIDNVTTVDTKKIKLCDIIHNSTHIAIITDILRDTNDNIIAIEVSEATTVGNPNKSAQQGDKLGGFCRRKMWNIDEWKSWFRTYKIYRYNSFTELGYIKSPYVDTGKEGNCMPPIDLPCIPYLGNKAKYFTGHIVNSKILIGSEGYSQLVVNKDGETFNTFQLSGEIEEITVGFSDTGNYEAHLVDNNGYVSYSCVWSVEAFDKQ